MPDKPRVERLNIPDLPAWRPGALYWRPLDDGNEITVYPTVTGGAQICLGPLADKFGYDESWMYAHVEECLEAARAYSGEGDPPGKWLRATGADEHGKHVTRRHGEPKINESFKIEEGDRVETVQEWGQAFPSRYLIERALPNGDTLQVEAVHDPRSPNGVVRAVAVHKTNYLKDADGNTLVFDKGEGRMVGMLRPGHQPEQED